MKNILFLILHGSVHKERVENVKKTWGENIDLLFYGDIEDIDKSDRSHRLQFQRREIL